MVRSSEKSFSIIAPDDIPASADNRYSISRLVAEFGISHRAIRFYCELGLISPLTTVGKKRVFDLRNAQRLSLVQKAKTLGMSLHEIGPLIVDKPRGKRAPVIEISDEIIQSHIAAIEKQQATMLARLKSLIGMNREMSSDSLLPEHKARSA